MAVRVDNMIFVRSESYSPFAITESEVRALMNEVRIYTFNKAIWSKAIDNHFNKITEAILPTMLNKMISAVGYELAGLRRPVDVGLCHI